MGLTDDLSGPHGDIGSHTARPERVGFDRGRAALVRAGSADVMLALGGMAVRAEGNMYADPGDRAARACGAEQGTDSGVDAGSRLARFAGLAIRRCARASCWPLRQLSGQA